MCQWFRQDVYVDPGTVNDLKFFDVNTGLICATGGIIYRTTNGGNNWVVLPGYKLLYGMEKIDSTALYAYGRNYNAYDLIYRTFDRGASWDSVAISGSATYSGISFINRDTGWVSAFGSGPVISMTTNGGITFIQQTTQVGWGKIFFLKYKINGGYYGWATTSGEMWKTTNAGLIWFQVNPTFGQGPGTSIIYFKNENSGFVSTASNTFFKTTNGGFNWTAILMPNTNGVVFNDLKFFDIIKNDTILGSGAIRQFPDYSFRGIIWKSTNGGFNWNFQQPDTSIHMGVYYGMSFIDSVTGWTSNLHPTNGGGPCFTVGVTNNNSIIPDKVDLKQNYPNPFNPSTTFEFTLPDNYYVSLRIYDIQGKLVTWAFIGFYLERGNHKYTMYDFKRLNPSSGVYFYQLELTDKKSKTLVSSITKKMIYLK